MKNIRITLCHKSMINLAEKRKITFHVHDLDRSIELVLPKNLELVCISEPFMPEVKLNKKDMN